MNIKKIIHKEFFIIIILVFVIFLFIKNINFFKNIYHFFSQDFEKRFTKKAYNYCAKDSIGYIYDITKKFKIRNNPLIINSDIQPDPSWVFLNTSNPKSGKYVILLNYIKNLEVDFKKKKNFFVNSQIVNASGIKEIEFLSKSGRRLKIDGTLKLYKIKVGTYNFKNFNKLSEKNVNLKKIDNLKINMNNFTEGKFKINKKIINFGGRGTVNLIKVFDNQNSEIEKIEKIRISLINHISLDDFEILDNFENKCFYLKKNG